MSQLGDGGEVVLPRVGMDSETGLGPKERKPASRGAADVAMAVESAHGEDESSRLEGIRKDNQLGLRSFTNVISAAGAVVCGCSLYGHATFPQLFVPVAALSARGQSTRGYDCHRFVLAG